MPCLGTGRTGPAGSGAARDECVAETAALATAVSARNGMFAEVLPSEGAGSGAAATAQLDGGGATGCHAWEASEHPPSTLRGDAGGQGGGWEFGGFGGGSMIGVMAGRITGEGNARCLLRRAWLCAISRGLW